MWNDFLALPLFGKIFAFAILIGVIAFFVLGIFGFCGYTKVEDENGNKKWKAQWVERKWMRNLKEKRLK